MNHSREFSKNEKELVELRLGGIFNPKEFADSIVAFVGLITGVSDDISPSADASDWAITVEEGSTLIRAMSNPDKKGSAQTVLKVVPIIHHGLTQLESNVKEDHQLNLVFSPKVLKHVGKMADLITKREGKTVSIRSDGKQVSLSSTIAENVCYLLGPKKAHSSIGNVEGQLSTLSDRRGFKMVVYRSLDGLAVECVTDDPHLEAEALKAFRKRVSVQGVVKYNNKGKPTSVKAKQIRVFRSESELIPLSEIRGALDEQA